MGKKISLTGIKPTGTPHIGNYLGAIRPALTLAEQFDARYFIADYHALNSIRDPQVLKQYTYEVAATWLACGLNPDEILFYRQSDVPEVHELNTMLLCFASKGRLNGAHAYKATVAENEENNKDPDKGVNMGLFTYPVLMAADILLYDADVVPIGKDQIQHLEITADIAEAMNFNYKADLFVIPQAHSLEEVQTVPGLDGRKMSKSYNNTIPLFVSSKKLRKTIMQMVTNSQPVEEPKDPGSCNIFSLYKQFAREDEIVALAKRYRAGGMGWGHAKEELFQVVDRELSPMRTLYEEYISQPEKVDKILIKGAEKARGYASDKIRGLREKLGF